MLLGAFAASVLKQTNSCATQLATHQTTARANSFKLVGRPASQTNTPTHIDRHGQQPITGVEHLSASDSVGCLLSLLSCRAPLSPAAAGYAALRLLWGTIPTIAGLDHLLPLCSVAWHSKQRETKSAVWLGFDGGLQTKRRLGWARLGWTDSVPVCHHEAQQRQPEQTAPPPGKSCQQGRELTVSCVVVRLPLPLAGWLSSGVRLCAREHIRVEPVRAAGVGAQPMTLSAAAASLRHRAAGSQAARLAHWPTTTTLYHTNPYRCSAGALSG